MDQSDPNLIRSQPTPSPLVDLAKRAAVVTGVVLLLTTLVVGAAFAFDVLLLAFAGVLFAVFLRGISDFISRNLGLGEWLSLALTVLLLVGVVAGLGLLMVPRIAEQARDMRETFPAAVERAKGELGKSETGRWVLEHVPSQQTLAPQQQEMLTRVAGMFSSALTGVVALVLMFFVGLYLAAAPRLYENGLLHLVPPDKRPRGREVLARLSQSLRWWLMGKMVAMFFVGVLVWVATVSLGLPFALSLAVIAAILTFIPNFGPILALIPAVLVGLMDSPATAAWVVVLYTAIQVVESYILTPFLQQSAVNLPAAITITAQVALGVFVGGVGLALATPLTVVILVLVRELYVRDLLGDEEV
jgi:predicted PurR-regulated permease PerM